MLVLLAHRIHFALILSRTILSYSDPGQEQAWRHTMSQSIGLEVMQLTLNFPSMGAAGKKLASKVKFSIVLSSYMTKSKYA